MYNKKLNILTPIPFWHPGTYELISLLKKHGYHVVALDIWDLKFFDDKEKVINLVPKYLPKKLGRIYRRLFRNNIIKTYIKKDQVVDIHWCGYYYSKYIKRIKKNSKRVYATLFGSDMYRSSFSQRRIQKKIFDFADFIVIGPNMKQDFLNFYGNYESKILFAQYGSLRLDYIFSNFNSFNPKEIKRKYKIPESNIVITIGYNSIPQQQHNLILDVIEKLDIEIKKNLFLILPLTYGLSKTDLYYKNLIDRIRNFGINNLVIEERVNDYELAEIRFVSDITINMQTTDALANSIKEAIAAQNILIVGDWLPYDIYEKLGIFLIRTNFEKLGQDLKKCIDNLFYFKQLTTKNTEKITNFASWNVLIKQFISNYNINL